MLTDAQKTHIQNQLLARTHDDLQHEHLFALMDDVWHLVKVGDEAFVDGSTIQNADGWLHTHVVPSYQPIIPSMLDMQTFASSDKPQGIMNYCSHEDVVNPTFWHSSIQANKDSLLGRQYRWGDYGSDGKGDCWAVIADWLRLSLGVTFPPIPRDYYDTQGYYYTLNHHGHTRLVEHSEPLAPGDILVIRIGKQGEHAGVYLGNGIVLHHAMEAVSQLTPAHRFMQRLHMRLRVIL